MVYMGEITFYMQMLQSTSYSECPALQKPWRKQLHLKNATHGCNSYYLNNSHCYFLNKNKQKNPTYPVSWFFSTSVSHDCFSSCSSNAFSFPNNLF